jgi:membrane protease YdiL (CAAX protease family)
MMRNKPSTRYYTEDVIAKVGFWFALVSAVLVIIWGVVYDSGTELGILQFVMLIMGKVLYPTSRLGRVEDSPLDKKSKRELQYTTGRSTFLLAVVVGVVAVLVTQTVLMYAYRMNVDTGHSFFMTYAVMSAGISESYLLHWGVQTNVAVYVNRWFAVLAVPLVAVPLHSLVYGATGVGVAIVFVMFLFFALLFELTKRLSVPMIVHLAINAMSLG